VFFDCLAAMGMAVGFCSLASGAPCNPGFVVQHGRTFTVLPTGLDDTANLQCAFDSAVAAGPGAVRLEKGTYHIRQIVVNNFKGSFTGAGAQQSVLTNLPNLYVTPVNMYYQTPSAANPWPSLVSFVGGDFLVSDIGMKITGAAPTTGWTMYGLPTLYDLALGFAVLGTTANAVFSRVDVEGQYAANPVCNYNLYNGIYFEGFIGQESHPISGSFVVQNSMLQHLGSATGVYNVANASILINHNNYRDVFDAMDVSGLLNTRYEFSFNTVEEASFGGYLYDASTAEGAAELYATSSEILVNSNAFSGQYGVYLDSTFMGRTTCQVVGNNFPNVTDLGIYLGAGTSHCLVVGNSQTTIENLGTDNVILDKDLSPKSMAGQAQMLRLWRAGAHR
jgi:hypothetical protein